MTRALILLLLLSGCAYPAPCGPSDKPVSRECIACLSKGSLPSCLG